MDCRNKYQRVQKEYLLTGFYSIYCVRIVNLILDILKVWKMGDDLIIKKLVASSVLQARNEGKDLLSQVRIAIRAIASIRPDIPELTIKRLVEAIAYKM